MQFMRPTPPPVPANKPLDRALGKGIYVLAY
jgi:hypothetical protein